MCIKNSYGVTNDFIARNHIDLNLWQLSWKCHEINQLRIIVQGAEMCLKFPVLIVQEEGEEEVEEGRLC